MPRHHTVIAVRKISSARIRNRVHFIKTEGDFIHFAGIGYFISAISCNFAE